MRTSTLVVALGLTLAACGGTASTTQTTEAPTPTQTTQVPITAAPTTQSPGTTQAGEPRFDVDHVFFMQDTGGTDFRLPPFMVSVYRDMVQMTAAEVVEMLMAGPSPEEEAAGISSAVPEVPVLGVTITDGVASVDLDSSFEAGGGTLMMGSRLAQVTWTLTALDGVESVSLLLDGTLVETFSGEGIILDGPMVREDFVDLLPGILVEQPAWGAPVAPNFTIRGTAAVFEAVFVYTVSQDGSLLVDETQAMTDNGVGWGVFETEIDLPADTTGSVTLDVWEYSAKDGAPQSERQIPLTVTG
jgi:germination protein M